MVIRVKFEVKSRVKHLATLDLPRESVALIPALIFYNKSQRASGVKSPRIWKIRPRLCLAKIYNIFFLLVSIRNNLLFLGPNRLLRHSLITCNTNLSIHWFNLMFIKFSRRKKSITISSRRISSLQSCAISWIYLPVFSENILIERSIIEESDSSLLKHAS